MAKKSNLLYNRWLRAKALSLWVNQEQSQQAFSLLEEAHELAPNNPGEALRNLAVKHYITQQSNDGELQPIRDRLEEMARDSDEGAAIWNNVQETGHFLPAPQTAKEDFAYPVLDEQSIRLLLANFAQ